MFYVWLYQEVYAVQLSRWSKGKSCNVDGPAMERELVALVHLVACHLASSY